MSTDRRALIVTGAIELIATRGIRALTHRALDTALALPAGSTSYYFRTRQALIAAVAHGITARSHADFAEMRTAHGGSATDQAGRGEPTTAGGEAAAGAGDRTEIARGIATWLDGLLTERHAELVARHALIIEVRGDAELRARLANSLFSLAGATELFTTLGAADPAATAADFLALLEGLVFDRIAGVRAGIDHNVEQLARPITRFLTGVVPDHPRVAERGTPSAPPLTRIPEVNQG